MYEKELENNIPILLAISTCPRCNRMKKFLENYSIEAKIVEIDLLPIDAKREHLRFLLSFNSTLSFPTLIAGNNVVLGEDYDRVKEVLDL